jgi:hypothetical protein
VVGAWRAASRLGLFVVIPAKAGIHFSAVIPAKAGIHFDFVFWRGALRENRLTSL